MHIVVYFVIAGYFALVMYLGYYSMKKVSNFDDYAVAGRSMPLPIFFAAIAAMIALWFTHATAGMQVLVGLIGFACSSIFSVIYSTALKCHPEKANEISGLMITGVCGGAVIPPLMGFTTDLLGSQTGSLLVISACMLYLAGCALALRRFAAK